MISPSIAYDAKEGSELKHIEELDKTQQKSDDFLAEISSRSPSHVRRLLAVAEEDADVFRAVTLALSMALGSKSAPSWDVAEMKRMFGYCAHVFLEESGDA